MSATTADGLTNTFNDEAIWKFSKAVFWIVVGFFVGGVVDYTFFHNHPLGQAIIKVFEDTLMSIFDFFATAFGLGEYTYSYVYGNATTEVVNQATGEAVREGLSPDVLLDNP